MDTKNTSGTLKSLRYITTALLLLLIAALIGYTETDEIPVATATDGQFLPWVTHDGEGGTLIIWEDYRNGKDWDIYAQRVDEQGETDWAENGIPLCTAPQNQRRLRMVRHEEHAVIVWNDRRDRTNWDIYAQAVHIDGKVLWETDGVPLCKNTADQSTQAILSDTEGGAICVWEDERRSAEFQDLYIQRINADGEVLWKKDGIPVYPSQSLQSDPILVTDTAGGFYIVWWDVTGYTDWHIMAYRLTLEGEPLWDAPLFVSPKQGTQGEPRVIPDTAGGLIVLWQIYENFTNDQLYAQRIAPNGEKMWGPNGVPICTAPGIQKHAALTADGTGGFIIAWRDERDIYSDLYMQRITADGTPLWERDGIPLCTAGGHQDRPSVIRTEENSFIAVWLDYREDFGEETTDAIYYQTFTLAGETDLALNGIPLSTTTAGQHYPPFLINRKGGHWAVVWSNTKKDNGDIYIKQF